MFQIIILQKKQMRKQTQVQHENRNFTKNQAIKKDVQLQFLQIRLYMKRRRQLFVKIIMMNFLTLHKMSIQRYLFEKKSERYHFLITIQSNLKDPQLSLKRFRKSVQSLITYFQPTSSNLCMILLQSINWRPVWPISDKAEFRLTLWNKSQINCLKQRVKISLAMFV